MTTAKNVKIMREGSTRHLTHAIFNKANKTSGNILLLHDGRDALPNPNPRQLSSRSAHENNHSDNNMLQFLYVT